MDDATISLDTDGAVFFLRKPNSDGSIAEIVLSDADVLKIAISAPALQNAVLAKLSRPGAVAVARIDVAQVGMDIDIQGSSLLLDLHDPNGLSQNFSIPLEAIPAMLSRLQEIQEKSLQWERTHRPQ